jgi:hypothetical protein
MVKLVYENDFGYKLDSFKFNGFLVEGSHFKKKASSKKKASPKKKKASPKKSS